jgi:N-acetylmuramoyl-L-alanine amidase
VRKIALLIFFLTFGTGLLGQVAKPPSPAPQPNPQIAAPLPQQPPEAPPAVRRPSLAVVVLDAAHGGADTGARGATGINESDITLEYAHNVRPALEAAGFRVVETRDDNSDPSFDERAAVANGQRNAIFITLHVASTGPPGQVRVYCEAASAEASAAEANSAAAASEVSGIGAAAPAANPPQQSAPHAISLLPTAFPARNGLLPWYRAQQSYAAASRRLAELVQSALAQKFAGTPASPFTAQIRQLRTIAAPAIAVEVSSVSVTTRSQLTEMSHDLAEGIARGVAAFRPVYEESAR